MGSGQRWGPPGWLASASRSGRSPQLPPRPHSPLMLATSVPSVGVRAACRCKHFTLR
jgi:hypothetical protein